MAVIEAIETVYLEADVASVTFSSLGSYEHLQVRISARSDYADELDWMIARLNGDSSSVYTYHRSTGYGSSAVADGSANTSGWIFGGGIAGLYGRMTSDGHTADHYGTAILDIMNYRNANKNTTVYWTGGLTAKTAADNRAQFASGLWDNTAAVTSIYLDPSGGTYFSRGSSFTLYGLNSS